MHYPDEALLLSCVSLQSKGKEVTVLIDGDATNKFLFFFTGTVEEPHINRNSFMAGL